MAFLKIVLNKEILKFYDKHITKFPKGTILTLETDEWGNIKDLFWRRRFRDSRVDGCLSLYQEPVKSPEISQKLSKPISIEKKEAKEVIE
jgi:hypothetical protein